MPQAKTPKTPKATTARKKPARAVPDIAGTIGNGKPPADLETEIRVRAYELYQERAGAPGNEHEDWLVAEKQVMSKRAGA